MTAVPAGVPAEAHGPARLARFDRVERLAHWLTALAFLVLVVTGAMLYVPALAAAVGRRALVERAHVDTGLALPLPLVVSLLGSWGRGLRADLRRLNRWSQLDRLWLGRVARGQRPRGLAAGKFNAGQKLNTAFTGGVMVVMLMTGAVMRWSYFWPLSWRTGATFVHDAVALAFTAVALGHVAMALSHPGALRSMFTGEVSRQWAERHAPLWLEEADGASRADGAGFR